jgi:hypothetical protein
MINVNDKRRICIVGYALSRVIHRIQSGIYFGNSDWYMEWLGTDGHWNPAYHSDLRTPPPLSVATLLPHPNGT